MPTVRHDGANLHWDSKGEGSSVLLIMGHVYSSALWYPLLPALTRNHRAIWFDNRGSGLSDTTSPTTIEQYAADARAVMEAAGVDKVHVYGVSMGGGIAAEFAIAYPEHTLSATLGCTLIKTEQTDHKGTRALVYRLPRFLAKWLMKRGASPEKYGPDIPREVALHDIEVIAKDRFTMRGARAQSKAIANYFTTRKRAIERLTMPVLILHGDEDDAVPVEQARRSHAMIRGSEYVEFKGAGHNYLIAANEASTAAYIEFIERVDAQRRHC